MIIEKEREIEEWQDKQIQYQERAEAEEEYEDKEKNLEEKLRMELQEDIYNE